MPFKPMSNSRKVEDRVRTKFHQWWKDSGETQEKVGVPIEWDQRSVSEYFLGNQQIDLVRAVKWCEFYGRTPNELFDDGDKRDKANPKLLRLTALITRADDELLEVIHGVAAALIGRSAAGRAVPPRRAASPRR
jgi:hypothetical protein